MNLSPTKLTDARREAGLTQAAAGQAINRTYKTIARYESGSSIPPSTILGLLAHTYDCTVDSFYS